MQEGLKIKREIQRNIELDNEKYEAKRRAGLEMMKYMVEENKKNEEEKEKVNEYIHYSILKVISHLVS